MNAPRSARAAASVLALCLLGLLFCAGAQASGGTALGWGVDFAGQVGDGTTGATPCECISTPAPVVGLSSATEIAAGESHSLALLADGTVMAWGANDAGQLGIPTIASSLTPVPVPDLAEVVAVAAGERHSLALLADGTVMAWGSNVQGGLGDGDTVGPQICGPAVCSTVPDPVPGLSGVVAIAAGSEYSLALLADGTVRAWGSDNLGQTGDGTGTRSDCLCIPRPTPVPGITGAMAISAGDDDAAALLADGTVRDWGRNNLGQLGNGALTPVAGCQCLGPVAVGGLIGAKAVAAGGDFGLSVLSTGSVGAWGFNGDDRLGSGAPTVGGCECRPTPGPVSGLASPQALAAGGSQTLALLPGGTVQAWGGNPQGQVGDGTAENRAVPTTLTRIAGASGVFAGERESFALIGPSQALKISLAGAGAGAVGGPGILCPSGCEARYPQGQVEILRAEPAAGSGFAGFSGPCTGTAPCRLRLDGDQAVTATFGPPKGTAITRAKLSSRKRSASFSFTAPGAITGFECALIRPKPARRAHKPRGHRRLGRAGHAKPKPHFSRCAAPAPFRHLKPGRYTFEVRALDILGADAHPARRHFTIKPHRARPKPRR